MADPTDSGIYEIVNLANGKRYIGSAKNFKRRWYMHRWALGRGRHHSFRLQGSWTKHGAAAFDFRVIEDCPAEQLYEREQWYLDAMRPVFNIAQKAVGGGGGMTDAGRARIAESNRRRTGWKMSPESLARMSAAQMGNTSTRGTRRSPAAIEATASAHRGMKRSPETRAKIAEKARGRKCGPRSAEHKAKLSAAMKARPANPERVAKMAATKRGSKLTEAHKAAIGAASRAAWERRKTARS